MLMNTVYIETHTHLDVDWGGASQGPEDTLGVAGSARILRVRREASTVDVPCTDGEHNAYVPPQVAGADAVQRELRPAPTLRDSTREEDGKADAVWWARIRVRAGVRGEL